MTEAEGKWWWTDFCKALPLYDHPLCLYKAVVAKLGSQDRVRHEIDQIRQGLGIRYSIASLRPALCRLLLSAGSLPPLKVQDVRQVPQVLCSSLPTSPASLFSCGSFVVHSTTETILADTHSGDHVPQDVLRFHNRVKAQGSLQEPRILRSSKKKIDLGPGAKFPGSQQQALMIRECNPCFLNKIIG